MDYNIISELADELKDDWTDTGRPATRAELVLDVRCKCRDAMEWSTYDCLEAFDAAMRADGNDPGHPADFMLSEPAFTLASGLRTAVAVHRWLAESVLDALGD